MEIRSHSLYRDLYRVLRFPINIYDSLVGCLETICTGREQNSIKSEHELVSDSTILIMFLALHGSLKMPPNRCPKFSQREPGEIYLMTSDGSFRAVELP
jgi:hypothetical protein